jgi:cation diffusion facilitator CzcD-associated flavoprotein CzcO
MRTIGSARRRADQERDARVVRALRAGELSPRVIILGAGAGGIAMAVRLRELGIDDVTILEKSDGFGGTWRDNTYPGCACDAPSHLYSFSFAPNPDWSRKFATQPEILDYLEAVAADHELGRCARFGVEVAEARYLEDSLEWQITTTDGEALRCDVLVAAMGQLNRPATPDIPGLAEFEGTTFHSARWDHSHDLHGERVAVIGNGASAVQFLPEIAPAVEHLTLFQRSANWVAPKPDRVYPAWERRLYRLAPWLRRAYRNKIYLSFEARFVMFHRNSRLGRAFMQQARKGLHAEVVARDITAEMVVPDYPPGCKRILISNDYYPALHRPNVTVTTSAIRGVEADAVLTEDGRRHEVDTIVFGTGFESTRFLAPVEVIGRDGRSLSSVWRDGAAAHLGMTVPDFPNLFLLYGPNTNLGHNSIIFMLECQVHYIASLLMEMVDRRARTVEVGHDAMRRYEDGLDRALENTVWAESCDSWYKTATGRITNNWPHTTLSYWLRTRHPEPGDFRFRSSPPSPLPDEALAAS